MLRMSFDQLQVKTVEELSLCLCSCVRMHHAWPVFMRANTLFMRMHLCSSVDMDTYPSMHAETLHKHMQILRAHAGT